MTHDDSDLLESFLSKRAHCALRNVDVLTFGDLKAFMRYMSPSRLHLVPNFGRKSYNEAVDAVGGYYSIERHSFIGPIKPRRSHIEAADRAGQIYAARRSGKTLREVGDLFEISPERVRQIYAKAERFLAQGRWQSNYIKAAA